MAKAEITHQELPKKIRFIMDKLITAKWERGHTDPISTIYGCYVTPDRLQTFVKRIYREKLETGDRYDFEIAPSEAKEAGGTVSIVYLLSKKADNLIRFTFYGEDWNCSLSMGTKLIYEEDIVCYDDDDDKCLHLRLEDQPDYVTVKDGNRTLFRWTPEEFSSDSLIETLQIPNSNSLTILDKYAKIKPQLRQMKK